MTQTCENLKIFRTNGFREKRWEGIVETPEFTTVGVTAQFFMACGEYSMLCFAENGVKTNDVLTADS